jgi:hypothetical protein
LCNDQAPQHALFYSCMMLAEHAASSAFAGTESALVLLQLEQTKLVAAQHDGTGSTLAGLTAANNASSSHASTQYM